MNKDNTNEQQKQLKALETKVTKSLKTAAAVLLEIRDRELWRASGVATWTEYLTRRWSDLNIDGRKLTPRAIFFKLQAE